MHKAVGMSLQWLVNVWLTMMSISVSNEEVVNLLQRIGFNSTTS